MFPKRGLSQNTTINKAINFWETCFQWWYTIKYTWYVGIVILQFATRTPIQKTKLPAQLQLAFPAVRLSRGDGYTGYTGKINGTSLKFIDWYLVGGFNHLEKYESMGMIIPCIMENKKCSKPPTSCIIWSIFSPWHISDQILRQIPVWK